MEKATLNPNDRTTEHVLSLDVTRPGADAAAMLREIADSHGVSPTITEKGTTVVTTPGGASYAFYEHSTSGRVPTVMTQVEITLPAGAKGRPDVHLKLRFPVREVK